MKTLEQRYAEAQAIRTWNAKFNVPPVCTALWTPEDFKRWEDGRKPLPPFEEWKESQMPPAPVLPATGNNAL